MPRINVASVQQYTIDRLRISLTWDFAVSDIKKLAFTLVKDDGTDCTDKVKTINESNSWPYVEEASAFDLYLQTNSYLNAGNYVFTLTSGSDTIYQDNIKLNYMEDVRVKFDKVELLSLNTLKITLQPINSESPQYQTREMLKLMKLSVIDSVAGTFFSDNFESLSDVIDSSSEDPITQFIVKLKSGKTLPEGYYDLRLTTVYKSRTFPIVEKFNVKIPFMTTTPPSIGSTYISEKSNGDTTVSVIFNSFMEKGMMNSAKRMILDENGRDITSWFDADKVSTTSYSLAGVSYIASIDIPLIKQYYALKKGPYTIKWTWNDPVIDDVVGIINANWVVNAMSSFSIFRLDFLNIYIPSNVNIQNFLSTEKYLVELNGEQIDPAGIFGSLEERHYLQYGTYEGETSNNFGIPILDFSSIERGSYTFILYHEENGERYYDYMGIMDIVADLTPEISSVAQTNIDTFTVTLKEGRPIRIVEMYIPKLLDQYGSIDFSNRLLSIADSNIWADKQTMVSRFDICINDVSTIASGKYLLSLVFRDIEVTQKSISLQYMETRKGMIYSVDQTSISTIKISFTEPQTRQFLLSTILSVERKVDGADFTDRFELLENVLKADQSIFTEIEFHMDHEDSFPAGRYRVSFLYNKSETGVPQTIYGFDCDLGYMTNNIPFIKSAVASKNASGLTELHVVFGNYLETMLYENAVFSVIRVSDDVDIETDFAEKDAWSIETSSLRGIRYIRGVIIPISDEEVTIERGNYSVEFSWPEIAYLNPVKASVFMEYQLPLVKLAEVSNVSPSARTARLYFELDESMQYSYFENLKVEVLDPAGNDVTDYFDTIQNSNNINASTPESQKIATNNFNLNLLNLDNITFGQYQFIFYHVMEGIRESHNMISLDITNATSPRVATAEQVAINKLMITLKNPIPRMLLEIFSFRFEGTNLVDHTDKFMSIDLANDWDEGLRYVTTFYIQIRGGYYCEEGSYLFTMYNGDIECDGYIFDIEHLEGATGEIMATKPVNLSTLEIVFREEESAKVFQGVNLQVLDSNGVDVSSKFEPLSDSTKLITTDYFDTINLKITGDVAGGIYNFIFFKIFKGEMSIISENTVTLPYMSNTYPLLYEVSATKLGSVMTGDDALVMWFNPALEKSLFDNSKFGIFRTANEDVELTNKFKPIEDAILDVEEKNGITYIKTATLEFANKSTLNRDTYTIKFFWDEEYSYMKNLERDVRLDYILFPVQSIEQVKADELLVTFKAPVSAKTLKNSELIVNTTYQTENIDGVVLTEVDFSTQFKSLQVTNDFDSATEFSTVTIKMGTRDVLEETVTLTEDNYNNYIGKRVKLSSTPVVEEQGLVLTKLANIYDSTVSLNDGNISSYMGKMVQLNSVAGAAIEKLTERNKDYYNGQIVVIYKPDEEWLNKEVDIYCEEAQPILPEGNYRFIIAETITDESGITLQYAYAGDCDISFMIDSDIFEATATAVQTSYDTIMFNFSKPQLTNVLSGMGMVMRYINPSNNEFRDYSNMLKDLKSANYYTKEIVDTVLVLTNDNIADYQGKKVQLSSNQTLPIEILSAQNVETYLNKEVIIYKDAAETGIFEYGEVVDVVINEIHYELKETLKAKAMLAANKAIPAHAYELGFTYNGSEYFTVSKTLPFMTSTPPSISDMEIINNELCITFNPKAELESLKASDFSIMTNRGVVENEDGTVSIKGSDVTSSFGSILSGDMDQVTEGEITYVKSIKIPVVSGAFLASGRYTLTWIWPASSFFPVSTYTGGLSVVAKGIKSARTVSADTIEVTLKDKVRYTDLRQMELAVRNSAGEDVTALFEEFDVSNPEDKNLTETDTFYVTVDDGDEVTSDIYTFTLSQVVEDDEDDDDSETNDNVEIEMLTWSMNIVYLASDFPDLLRVDNMSIEKYEVIMLTNANSNVYIGKMIQLNSSNDADDIVKLTKRNVSSYINNYIRVYSDARIDQLSFAFDEPVNSSLINALEVSIKTDEGIDVTDSFRQPGDSTTFKTTNLLKGFTIKFPTFISGEELLGYDIDVTRADGTEITDLFEDIEETNDLEDDLTYNTLYYAVRVDETIEEKDIHELIISITDGEGDFVEGFTYETVLKKTLDTMIMDMDLETEKTIIPGIYSAICGYTNEPDIEDSVMIYPFKWTGTLPFFSTNLGEIEEVTINDMESFNVKFSNMDLPVSIFSEMDFQLINEDGEEVDAEFENIHDSNDFDDCETLNDLETPGVIKIQLEEGYSVPSGTYNLRFLMDLTSTDDNDASGDEDDDDDDTDDSGSLPRGQYCLWEKTEVFPYMFRDMTNSLTGIEILGIDRLRVTLEKPMDVSLLRDFTFDMYDPNKGIVHSDLFEDLSVSNFFGMYLMSTDERYILYSEDGSSWNRFDTGFSYGFTKIFFHEPSGYYFTLCTNGKIIKFNTLDNVSYSGSDERPSMEVNYSTSIVKKSLNDYVLLNDGTIVIVGNDGTILKGTLSSNGTLKLTNINEGGTITKKTLTSIITIPADNDGNVTLLAVGYNGTVIVSNDNGSTWETISTGTTSNLTDAFYYENTLEIENEDNDPEDDPEEESGTDEDDVDNDSVASSEVIHKAVFIVGTNGTILYNSVEVGEGEDSDEDDNVNNVSIRGFSRINSETSSALFSIAAHNDTIIAVGDNGIIINISDGEDGFVVGDAEVDASFALRDVKWCDNRFVACGSTGKWVSSIAGNNWSVNSTIYSTPLKAVNYIPNQYGDTKGDWFNLRLKDGQELGAVSFFSGEDEPTLESEFCSSWTTPELLKQHLNDIYIQKSFDATEYRNVATKYWKFVSGYAIDTDNANEEDDTDVTRTLEYFWEEIANIDIPHTGAFYGRLRLSSDEDTFNWKYSTPSAVNIPYMTSNPGNIESVSLTSPDVEDGIAYRYPFLKIILDELNENALHYATFSVINKDTNEDYSAYFKSIRLSDRIYSDDLTTEGLCLYGTSDVNSLPAGNYKFTWKWIALGSDEVNIDFKVKAISNILSLESASMKYVNLTLSQPLPKSYLVATEDDYDFNLNFSMLKIPEAADSEPEDVLNSLDISNINHYTQKFQVISDEYPYSTEKLTTKIFYNVLGKRVRLAGTNDTPVLLTMENKSVYMDNKVDIFTTNPTVSTVDYDGNGDVIAIHLLLKSYEKMNSGNYMIKFHNPTFEYPTVPYSDVVKENESNMFVSTAIIKLDTPMAQESDIEATDSSVDSHPQPVISSVSLVSYGVSQEENENNDSVIISEGIPSVDTIPEMAIWINEGKEAEHVGSKYIDNSNGNEVTYVYTYNEETGVYEWQVIVKSPHLLISFSTLPLLSTFNDEIIGIDLVERCVPNENDPETKETLYDLNDVVDKGILKNYWKDKSNWIIETTDVPDTEDDEESEETDPQVIQVYIPFNTEVSGFPGADDAKLTLKFSGNYTPNVLINDASFDSYKGKRVKISGRSVDTIEKLSDENKDSFLNKYVDIYEGEGNYYSDTEFENIRLNSIDKSGLPQPEISTVTIGEYGNTPDTDDELVSHTYLTFNDRTGDPNDTMISVVAGWTGNGNEKINHVGDKYIDNVTDDVWYYHIVLEEDPVTGTVPSDPYKWIKYSANNCMIVSFSTLPYKDVFDTEYEGFNLSEMNDDGSVKLDLTSYFKGKDDWSYGLTKSDDNRDQIAQIYIPADSTLYNDFPGATNATLRLSFSGKYYAVTTDSTSIDSYIGKRAKETYATTSTIGEIKDENKSAYTDKKLDIYNGSGVYYSDAIISNIDFTSSEEVTKPIIGSVSLKQYGKPPVVDQTIAHTYASYSNRGLPGIDTIPEMAVWINQGKEATHAGDMYIDTTNSENEQIYYYVHDDTTDTYSWKLHQTSLHLVISFSSYPLKSIFDSEFNSFILDELELIDKNISDAKRVKYSLNTVVDKGELKSYWLDPTEWKYDTIKYNNDRQIVQIYIPYNTDVSGFPGAEDGKLTIKFEGNYIPSVEITEGNVSSYIGKRIRIVGYGLNTVTILDDNNKANYIGKYVDIFEGNGSYYQDISNENIVLAGGLTGLIGLPEIASVTIEEYAKTPDTDDGIEHTNLTISGEEYTGDPNTTMSAVVAAWTTEGKVANHVGDKYIDASTEQVWYFNKQVTSGNISYIWELYDPKPHLVISFSGYPASEVFNNEYSSFDLNEMYVANKFISNDKTVKYSLTSYWETDKSKWIFETHRFEEETNYKDKILQIYVPMKTGTTFTGCESGTLDLKFSGNYDVIDITDNNIDSYIGKRAKINGNLISTIGEITTVNKSLFVGKKVDVYNSTGTYYDKVSMDDIVLPSVTGESAEGSDSNQPSIAAVTLEKYGDVPNTDDGLEHPYMIYSDRSGDPNVTMAEEMFDWAEAGEDTQKYHIGDKYIDASNTDNIWYYGYESKTSSYKWISYPQSPHLILTFDNYPLKSVFENEYVDFEFDDYSKEDGSKIRNLKYVDGITTNPYWKTPLATPSGLASTAYWKFETKSLGSNPKVSQIVKIAIPLNDTVSFPGAENAKFTLYFKGNHDSIRMSNADVAGTNIRNIDSYIGSTVRLSSEDVTSITELATFNKSKYLNHTVEVYSNKNVRNVYYSDIIVENINIGQAFRSYGDISNPIPFNPNVSNYRTLKQQSGFNVLSIADLAEYPTDAGFLVKFDKEQLISFVQGLTVTLTHDVEYKETVTLSRDEVDDIAKKNDLITQKQYKKKGKIHRVEVKITNTNYPTYIGKRIRLKTEDTSMITTLTKANSSKYIGKSSYVYPSTEKRVVITESNKSMFYNQDVDLRWSEVVDEYSKFKSISESNEFDENTVLLTNSNISYYYGRRVKLSGTSDAAETLTTVNQAKFLDHNIVIYNDERVQTIRLLLSENQWIDHGTYTLTMTGAKASSDLIDAEKVQTVDEYGVPQTDVNGEPIYEEKMVEFKKTVNIPWLTTEPPKKLKASISTGKGNPILTIKFSGNYPALSSILKSGAKANGEVVDSNCLSNGTVDVIRHDGKQGNYSDCFRELTGTSTKFTFEETNAETIEKFVTRIDIRMKNNHALRKGTYNVFFNFANGSYLGSIPNVVIEGYTQFTTSSVTVSKLGCFKKTHGKKKKLILELKANKEINTDAKLAKCQAAKVLGVNSWAKLLKKFTLTVKKGKTSYQSMLSKKKSDVKATQKKYQTKIKKNKKIKPGKYKFGMTYKGLPVITAKSLQFSGLIWNSVGKAGKDPKCWILKETSPDGVKKTRVYKKYKKALKRVDKLKKLNRIAQYQYKLCKECRKINLLSTKKIKGCINQYDIPYTKHKKKITGIAKFFKQLVKKWYKFRTKDAKSNTWKVALVTTGYSLNKKAEKKESSDPTKKFTYKCSAKADGPFPGFKFEKHVESAGDENLFSMGCANYTKKSEKYKWSWDIATVYKGKFPGKKSKKKIYFATITWKGVDLSRGYKCGKKGKKSSKYKKYVKKLQKKIKKRKKAIATCNKCKKHMIARKGKKNIGWGSALFPSRVKTLKRMKGLPAFLNVKNSKGGYKKTSKTTTGGNTKKKGKKKSGWGCKKPKFTWAKTTIKKKVYTKLKCKNCKATDNTLKTGGFQGIYYK